LYHQLCLRLDLEHLVAIVISVEFGQGMAELLSKQRRLEEHLQFNQHYLELDQLVILDH
jgi:hypothetical protein